MKTLSQLQDQADKLFSEWIRRRNAVNDIATCVTCGKKDHWKYMQCGHYISRDRFAVRYHPKNAHVQCSVCNSAHNDNKEPYMMFMLKTYEGGTIPELTRLSMLFISSLDKRQTLENVIKDMKIKLRKL